MFVYILVASDWFLFSFFFLLLLPPSSFVFSALLWLDFFLLLQLFQLFVDFELGASASLKVLRKTTCVCLCECECEQCADCPTVRPPVRLHTLFDRVLATGMSVHMMYACNGVQLNDEWKFSKDIRTN